MKTFGILILAFVAIGCTKGMPKFEGLVAPQPLFSGAITRNQTVADPTALIPVSGTCDPQFTSLEFRLTSSGVWGPATAIADGGVATVDCTTTGFSFNLPSLVTMGINVSAATIVTLEARGIAGPLTSSTSTLNLRYAGPSGVPTVNAVSRITQGNSKATSPSFSVDGSVNFRSPTATSGSHAVKPKNQ